MLLDELFNSLADGELTNLSLVSDGTIAEASRPKIVKYANEALLRLYSRFTLNDDDVLVMLTPGITFYHLIPRFSFYYTPTGDQDDEPIRYLLDSPGDPFKDEVLRILSVYDNFGRKIPLNDEKSPASVFSQGKILQVPTPCTGVIYSVRYQRSHTKLTGDPAQEIDCPEVLQTALTSFIAYKAFSHMNSRDSSAKAQEFMATYESLCQEVISFDLVNTSVTQSNARFQQNGWV